MPQVCSLTITPYEAKIRATAAEALAVRDHASNLLLLDMFTLIRYGLYDRLLSEFEELPAIYRDRMGMPPASLEEDQEQAPREVTRRTQTPYELRLRVAVDAARAAGDTVNGDLLEDLIDLVHHGRYRPAQNLFQFLAPSYRDRVGAPPPNRDLDLARR